MQRHTRSEMNWGGNSLDGVCVKWSSVWQLREGASKERAWVKCDLEGVLSAGTKVVLV